VKLFNPKNSFLYLDETFLFETSQGFLNIKSKEYLYIIDSLGNKIKKFSHDFGLEKFNKYCSYAFKTQFIDKTKKELGKLIIAFIFCFKQDTNDEVMDSFKKQIRDHYSKSLITSTKFLKMQQYKLNQNILMQYYEHHINLENIRLYNLQAKDLPTYWTAITKEGMVMNRQNTFIPKTVMFSFRHDQVIKCSGFHPEFLKMHLQPKIKGMFKSNNCCISYVVDTFTYCNSVMFCSNNPSKWKCNAEIQIFKASLYTQCMNEHIINLDKDLFKKYKGNIHAMKNISFLEKAKHIYTLREIINYDFTEIYTEETQMFKIIKPIMNVAMSLHKDFMVLIRPHCLASFTGKNSSITEEISNFTLNFFCFVACTNYK
jgi:hypothetical protein